MRAQSSARADARGADWRLDALDDAQVVVPLARLEEVVRRERVLHRNGVLGQLPGNSQHSDKQGGKRAHRNDETRRLGHGHLLGLELGPEVDEQRRGRGREDRCGLVHPTRVNADNALVRDGHTDEASRVDEVGLAIQDEEGERRADDHRSRGREPRAIRDRAGIEQVGRHRLPVRVGREVVLKHAAEARLDEVDPTALVPVDVELPLAQLVLPGRKTRPGVALVDVLDDNQVVGRGGRGAGRAGNENVSRDGRREDREARVVDVLAWKEDRKQTASARVERGAGREG